MATERWSTRIGEAIELRHIGIIGDIPWGTHFCHLYETKQDLLDILIPYLKLGLENNEFCLWVVSDPLGEQQARNALRQAMPEAERYLAAGQVKIIPHTECYLPDGTFLPERVINYWDGKLAQALKVGFAGMRVAANESWLTQENWKDFSEYERTLDETLANRRMIVVCSYPLSGAGAAEILDVARTHSLAVAKRNGNWEILETPALKQVKAKFQNLREELAQPVAERSEFAPVALPAPPVFLGYAVAVLSVIAALIALWGMDASLHVTPEVSLFLCAVLLSAWYGGVGPGILTIVLSALAFAFFFLPPTYSLAVESTQLPRLLLFVVLALFVATLTIAQKRAAESLRHARDDLNKTNKVLQAEIIEHKQTDESLWQSEERYRDLTDLSPDAIYVINADTTLVLANPAGARLVGCSLDELVGTRMTDTYLPEERHLFLERIETLKEGPLRFERTFLRRDGQMVPVEVSLSALRGGRFQSIVRDITERKQAEDEIRQHVARMEALAEISKALAQVGLDVQAVLDTIARRIAAVIGDGCLINLWSSDGQWVERRVFHHTRPEIESAVVSLLPRKEAVSTGNKLIAEILRTGQGVLIPVVDEEYLRESILPLYRPAIRQFGLASLLVVPLRLGGRVIGTVTLVREQPGRPYTSGDQALVQELADRAALTIQNARLFEQVQGARRRLQTLSSQLLVAQEAERRQVARELHDQIGQVLTAVSADLQALEPTPDPTLHAERLEGSLRLVDEALHQVRDLALDLRPALLDDLGLGPALEWYLERQAQRSGLRAELVVEPPELRLPPELETTLFRLTQIALTNVARHAQAKEVRVEVGRRDGHVELVVRDDGVGFDVPAALDRASRGDTLGLVSLQERAQLASGEVEILSTPGQGTEIRARFPLE